MQFDKIDCIRARYMIARAARQASRITPPREASRISSCGHSAGYKPRGNSSPADYYFSGIIMMLEKDYKSSPVC